METVNVSNIEQLVRIVGGSRDPKDQGPIVLEAALWDGRTVIAEYYRSGPKWNEPDAQTNGQYFSDPWKELSGLVSRLITTGEPFVTVCGVGRLICALQWKLVRRRPKKAGRALHPPT